MKKLSTLFLALVLLPQLNIKAQDQADFQFIYLIAGGGKNFEITGKGSNEFANALFRKFPEKRRKGYVWKFKNMTIPGLEKPVTFQVHQGLAGRGENGTTYFHTFTSENYKKEKLSQKNPTEQDALIIYVKRGRKYVLQSNTEALAVEKYLRSLLAT